MAANPQPEPLELWRHPNPSSTPMHKFLEHVRAKYKLDILDYPGLYKWSIENITDFWHEVWQFCGIKASRPYSEVSQGPVTCIHLSISSLQSYESNLGGPLQNLGVAP